MQSNKNVVKSCSLPIVVLAAIVHAAPAHAQTDLSLAELLPDLILRGITLPRPTTSELSHEAHFSPIDSNELNNPAVGIVRDFNKLMIVQLSTFPLGSSSGGFTFAFDKSLGTFRRESGSFGPAFAERAVTNGRGKLNAGITYQHTPYRSFEGQLLDDGSIKFYLRHQECCSPGSGGGSGGGGGGGGGSGPVVRPNGTRFSPQFEGDLIEAALSMNAATDTVAFFGNYGITSRWDVGIVVPITRVELEANVQATILRLATAASPLTHTFEAGNPQATQKTFRESGSATGFGDVLLRTKYRLMSFGQGGVAGALDVRLPTGSQEDLLGAGSQIKMMLIASGAAGRISPHVNVGYAASGGKIGSVGLLSQLTANESLPDEFTYATGVEFTASPRLTLIGDIVGRTLRRAGRLELADKPFQFVAEGSSNVQTASFEEFEPRSGSLNLLLGAAGIKYSPVGTLLISANVLFPLTDAGLRSRVTTVIGIDVVF
jgi:hypothetical protein